MERETYLKIELKYCERCGGLWLRYGGSQQVYCVTCAPDMEKVARGAKKQAASVKWRGLQGGDGMRIAELEETQECGQNPELALYRQRTIAMLKKNIRMSV